MADYFIGDLQGCYSGLQKALATIEFNPAKDTLWLTGDLIARGENSLATLEYLYKYQDSVQTVLGNHDLHFLAVANGLKRANPKDKLTDLLASPKLNKLIDWLRAQPLLHRLPDQKGYMSHAGLAPEWKPKTAKTWAKNVSESLSSQDYKSFLPLMYGNKPCAWNNELSDEDKLRFSISAFTRMRFCDHQGALNFDHKGAPQSLIAFDESSLIPWFCFNPDRFDKHMWIFGHWASLMGETGHKNVIALDTGYVWGNHLTILDWQKKSKIKVFADQSQ